MGISRPEGFLKNADVLAVASFTLGAPLYEIQPYLAHVASGGKAVRAILDRNLFSPIVNQAAGQPIRAGDRTARVAAGVMAFLNAARIGVEPNVAVYEVAQCTGHAHALEELARFHLAQDLAPKEFFNLALNYSDKIPREVLANTRLDSAPTLSPEGTFEKSLTIWKFHRLVLTKIAMLLRQELAPVERLCELYRRSAHDAYLSGNALVLATIIFSPKRSGRLLKRIESAVPERRVAGIDNATWDLSYVSQFVEYAKADEQYWLFCSAERSLRDFERLVLYSERNREALDSESPREAFMLRYWPKNEARLLLDENQEIDAIAEERRGEVHSSPTGQ